MAFLTAKFSEKAFSFDDLICIHFIPKCSPGRRRLEGSKKRSDFQGLFLCVIGMEKRVTEGLADLIFQSGEASFPCTAYLSCEFE